MAIKDYNADSKGSLPRTSAVMGRGYVFFQQGKHAEAIEDFSRAIELNPNDPVAFNNRGYNRYQLAKIRGSPR